MVRDGHAQTPMEVIVVKLRSAFRNPPLLFFFLQPRTYTGNTSLSFH